MCKINCSGGCPDCAPEDHKMGCNEYNSKIKNGPICICDKLCDDCGFCHAHGCICNSGPLPQTVPKSWLEDEQRDHRETTRLANALADAVLAGKGYVNLAKEYKDLRKND